MSIDTEVPLDQTVASGNSQLMELNQELKKIASQDVITGKQESEMRDSLDAIEQLHKLVNQADKSLRGSLGSSQLLNSTNRGDAATNNEPVTKQSNRGDTGIKDTTTHF